MSTALRYAAATPAVVLARPASVASACSTHVALGTTTGRGWTMSKANADFGKRITPGVLGGST